MKTKCDLTKNFDQPCVSYHWKGYLSGTMGNGCWGVANEGISHQRSFKVIIQGHVTKKGDLTKIKTLTRFVLGIIGYVP